MKYLLFLVFIFLLSSCCKEDFDSSFKGDGTQINIYLVKDGQIDYSNKEVNLESLELDKEPWLKHSEIEFYDWSAHMFYLNTEKERAKYSGKYFLVKADNEPLFLGYFMSPVSSSFSYFPSITAWDGFYYSDVIIKIGGFVGFHRDTMDANIEFKNALKNAELLKEGIEVYLEKIRKENSASIKYTYKVTNLDTEKIYILDPEKMGASRFHYYTNGVSFIKNDKYYYAEDKDVTSVKNFNSSWYYKLAPGQTITRTVILEGFSSLPSGEVKCHFSFPGLNLKNNEWEKSDGRIWLGNFRVEKEMNLR